MELTEFNFMTKSGLDLAIVADMDGHKELVIQAFAGEVDIWEDLSNDTRWDIRRALLQRWIDNQAPPSVSSSGGSRLKTSSN